MKYWNDWMIGKELKDLLVPNPHHEQRPLHNMASYYNEII